MPHQPWTARIILRQMADNLIFPIGFDLEKGVADAQKQMDAALKRLQKTADSRPLTIPMSLDASKFTTFEAALRGSIQHITDDAKNLKAALDNSLQTDNSANINRITEAMRNLEAAWKALPNNQKFDINDRLTPKAQEMVRQFNELATASSTYGQTLSQIAGKIKRAAEEEAKANQKRNDGYAKLRKTLGAQENSIANLSAKIKAYQQILNSKEVGSKSFERVAEKIRKLTKQLGKAKEKVAELTGQTQSGAARQSAAVRQVSNEFKNQETYVSRLLKRMAVYASFSYTGNFLTNVREVTAQFELQRVSLGAILQSQEKANQLFSEIKAFALKSPVSILDLTKYTKQLAAYKIGYDELFETTKKLTDVSVGLGVSMDRVVLAYGQVRATGYLRASEVRQFTEMGVPIVEELAAKLEKLNGEAVTAADVMELISKRGISFEMVKEVFDDMTSAGGMFYNMQEKQGNTLFGLWAKLGDAASVMYDEIGNTSIVNSGMKEAIRLLSDLMRNWRNVGLVVAESAAVFAIWKLQAVNAALVTNALTAAEVRALAVKKVHYKMQPAIIRGIIGETNARKLSIITVRAHAAAVRASATSTNIFTKAWYSLKAAFLSNPFGIALTALAAIATYLMFADDKVKRFKEDLDSIKEGGAVEATKSAYNFEQLAEKAVNAADGSMEQKDALDELQRTYKDMIPIQDLTIEKLKALKGNYDSLTQSIKEYVYQRNLQQQIDRIIEERTGTMTRIEQKLRDEMKEGVKYQVGDAVHTKDLGIDDNQISALFSRIKTEAKNTTKDVQTIIRESVDEIFGYLSQEDRNILYAMGYNKLAENTDGWLNTLQSIIELQRTMDGEIENTSTSMSQYTGYLGEYKKELDNITESVKKYRMAHPTTGEAIERDTFLFQQGQQNFQIKQWANSIKSDLESAGVTIQEGVFNLVDRIAMSDPTKISTIDFTKLLPMLDSPEVKQKLGNSYETFKNYVLSIQKLYDGIVPSDPIVQAVRNKLYSIGNATKGGMDVMKKYLWDGKTSIEEHLKTLKASSDTLQAELYKYANYIKQYGILGKAALLLRGIDYDALAAEYDALTKQIEYVQTYVKEKDSNKSRGGSKSDPRLQNLKEEISLYEKLYQEYKQYEKAVGSSKAAEYMEREAKDTIDALAEKYGIGLPKNVKDLTAALEILYKKMQALPSKVFKNLDKELKEFRWKIEKVDIDESQKNIEAELKRLADRISRTKTAKEFYEKILGMTGDVDLAANVSLQIYGSTGRDLKEQIKEQFAKAFEGVKPDHADIMPDVTDIINRGAYEELRDYIALLPEAQRKAAEDLVKAQQQMSVKQYEQWLKDLEKAKDYADKRIELSRYTANQIAAIEERIAKLDPAASDYEQQKAMLEKLIAGYKSREVKMGAELDYEQFKNSALYVQVFENLDNASKTALENMRNRLLALKDQWKNLSPEKVKELTKRLEELDAQIAQRNPFKSIADNIKKLREMRMDGRTKEGDAQKAFDAEVEREAAEAKMLADEKAYEAAVKQYGEESDIAKEKRKIADDSAEAYRNAEKTADSAAENADEWGDVAEAISAANQKIDEYQSMINDALDGIRKMMEAFGASEEDMQFFDDVVGSLNEIVDAGQQAVTATANIMSGNPAQIFQGVTQGVGAVTGIVSGISNLFSAGKVKRANKEIKRQQELLEQLEYTYGRLEAAADKVFGRDYLNNYNQQLKNLQAQQAAYEKQARAERSKGKKKDEEKIKEYENQARETADKIKELQDDLVAHFTGSSRTDVARQMAKSWIDARASMSDTFAAIKGDYADMIKNMIVEGAAARVIENALTPVWDSMEKMLAKNDVQGAIDSLVNGMDSALNAANNGMEVLWKALEARGYDMKKLIGDTDSEYTGIAKSVAGATSEEILQLSGFVNTALYHTAYLPKIYEELVAMRTASLPTATVSTTSAGWTDWQQQAMDNYMAIQRNTADTVVECRRAANACEKMMKVIKTKGATSGFNVFLNA